MKGVKRKKWETGTYSRSLDRLLYAWSCFWVVFDERCAAGDFLFFWRAVWARRRGKSLG